MYRCCSDTGSSVGTGSGRHRRPRYLRCLSQKTSARYASLDCNDDGVSQERLFARDLSLPVSASQGIIYPPPNRGEVFTPKVFWTPQDQTPQWSVHYPSAVQASITMLSTVS